MKEGLEPSVFRADRTGLRFILGDLQAETMAAIWATPQGQWVTVREVFEVLKSRRPIAYTTVGTIMARLEKKRLLKAKKVDRAYVYYPTMGQAEFTFRFVARILDQILESYPSAAVSHLAHLAEPESREAVQKLLAHIVERSKDKRRSTKWPLGDSCACPTADDRKVRWQPEQVRRGKEDDQVWRASAVEQT